jgi:hypothetical protein
VTWLRVLATRMRGLLAASRRDAALDDEIATHLEMPADDYLRRGLAPAEARRATTSNRSSGARSSASCRT